MKAEKENRERKSRYEERQAADAARSERCCKARSAAAEEAPADAKQPRAAEE